MSGSECTGKAELHREVRALMVDPDAKRELGQHGLIPVASPPPAELRRFVAAEIARMREIVRKAGLEGSQ